MKIKHKLEYKLDKTVNDIKHKANKTANKIEHKLHFTNNLGHARADLQEGFRYELDNSKIKIKDFFTGVEDSISKLIDECQCLGDSTTD